MGKRTFKDEDWKIRENSKDKKLRGIKRFLLLYEYDLSISNNFPCNKDLPHSYSYITTTFSPIVALRND